MPGIVGIIGPGEGAEEQGAVRQMVGCLMHESFYESGTYGNEKLGIWAGWVNDKESFSCKMPIWNEKNDVCLIFSGADFRPEGELAALRARGHEFRPKTVDYLVHFYEEIGEKFLESLNGRFSGIVIDFRVPSFMLFNDRYGLNRLYYHEREGRLFFSSEAKALLKVLPDLRRIDLASWGDFFSCHCVLQNRTLFAGISLMPAGSSWTFGPRRTPRKSLYFSPKAWETQEPFSRSEYYQRLRDTWANVLPRYLHDREPSAISLTGGKDSRMIMAWARLLPDSLPCYTFGGPFRECRDVVLARQVARVCQQSHRIIPLDRQFLDEFPELAERTVFLTDGTMDVTGAAELYLNKAARQIAPARLTGNYGQEILFRSVAFKPFRLYEEIFSREFRGYIETASKIYFRELEGNRLSFIAFKQVPWFHYSRQALELTQVMVRSPFLDNDLVALSFRAPMDLGDGTEIQLRLIAEGNSALGKIYTDQGLLLDPKPGITRLANLYQTLTFKAEYAYDAGMPQSMAKLDHILRHLRLERFFLGRHKFHHYRIWFRDQLSGFIKEVLLDTRARQRPYLNGRNVESLIGAHIQGTANFTAEIHRLLTAEIIFRKFID